MMGLVSGMMVPLLTAVPSSSGRQGEAASAATAGNGAAAAPGGNVMLQEGAGAVDHDKPRPIGGLVQWIRPDDYPSAAIRAGAQGRVVADLAVDAHGRVTACTVRVSSGSPDLDAKTCEIAMHRASFEAARDATGRPVASTYILPVRWQLPRSEPALTDLPTTLVSIGPDGAVLSCASTMPTPLGDLCGAFPTGRKLDVPVSMRGRVFVISTMIRPLAE